MLVNLSGDNRIVINRWEIFVKFFKLIQDCALPESKSSTHVGRPTVEPFSINNTKQNIKAYIAGLRKSLTRSQ